MDPSVRVGGDSGKPIVISHPESAAARAFVAIAQDIAAKLSVAAVEGSSAIPINIIG
jgi:ATP-binding protein involved in chromosome partitioning